MRQFESRYSLLTVLLAALAFSAVACSSSDTDHGPPIGSPGPVGPVVVTEDSGGYGGTGIDIGQGAATNGGDATGVNDPSATAGAFGQASAGSASAGVPGFNGSAGSGPFGASGGPSTFGLGGGF